MEVQRLDAPGVEALTGAGIYYGAAPAEAEALRDQDVFVVGGANSAGQATVLFSTKARRVVMLVRGASLEASMSGYLVKRIKSAANVELVLDTVVRKVDGAGHLESIEVENRKTGEVRTLPAAAMFIFTGSTPRSQFV